MLDVLQCTSRSLIQRPDYSSIIHLTQKTSKQARRSDVPLQESWQVSTDFFTNNERCWRFYSALGMEVTYRQLIKNSKTTWRN